MKKASILNKRNLTDTNAQKLKKSQRELMNIRQKESQKFIQCQINKIKNLVEDRQSRLAWPTGNKSAEREWPQEQN